MAAIQVSKGDVGPHSIGYGATFSLKLLALIDQMFSGLVDTLAGTGRRIHRHYNRVDLMNQREEDKLVTVDTADGWVFAYEGGAHILFRHTTRDQHFVRHSLTLPSVEAVQS
jgi:hypothetical protein